MKEGSVLMYMDEFNEVIEAAVEWAGARQDVLRAKGDIPAAMYNRLAKAEAELQKAVGRTR